MEKKLIQSIIIDTIGALPTIIAALSIVPTGFLSFLTSEIFDIIWAPTSAVLIYVLYKDNIMSLVNFSEEILPGTDIIPTATIAYFKNEG